MAHARVIYGLPIDDPELVSNVIQGVDALSLFYPPRVDAKSVIIDSGHVFEGLPCFNFCQTNALDKGRFYI